MRLPHPGRDTRARRAEDTATGVLTEGLRALFAGITQTFLGSAPGEVVLHDDLERFRDLVEGGERPTGSWRGSIEDGEVTDPDPLS